MNSFVNWETNEESEQIMRFNESYKAFTKKNLQKLRKVSPFDHVTLLTIQRKESLLTERKKKNQQSMAQIFGKESQDGVLSQRRMKSQNSTTNLNKINHDESLTAAINEYRTANKVTENSPATRNYQLPETAESSYVLP